jgi:hypothetical protein
VKISMIGCPFQTSFGCYISSLRDAIERKAASPVQWVASNCGCGDPVERGRQFQVLNCDYFEMPMPADYRSNPPGSAAPAALPRPRFYIGKQDGMQACRGMPRWSTSIRS